MLKYISQRLQLKIILVVAFALLIPTALISSTLAKNKSIEWR